jgi:hypothetical protein
MTFCPVADPTLNDVILTNSPNNCMNVLNFNCGISDVHNLISVQIKCNINHISMKGVLADQNLLTFIQQLNHF